MQLRYCFYKQAALLIEKQEVGLPCGTRAFSGGRGGSGKDGKEGEGRVMREERERERWKGWEGKGGAEGGGAVLWVEKNVFTKTKLIA